jgi:gliding motility-associated-like protein
MKHFYKYLYTAVLLSLCPLISPEARAQYCTPTYTTSCLNVGATDFIVSFSTTGGSTNITNNNTNCGGSTNYTYYSTMTHTSTLGGTVNFSVSNNPTWPENFGIWVDWNQDLDFFDAGEQVFTGVVNAGATLTGSFTVPLTASAGTTRMRIRNVYSAATTPCTQETFGEAEDYNFNVNSPCTGTPTATAVSTTSTACPTSSFTLSLTGLAPATGYTYQWQSAPLCSSTFTNLPAPSTGSTYSVTNLGVTTQYRAVITCTNSGLSYTTNAVTVSATANCYCASTPTGFQNEDIGQITVGTYSNPATPPASLTQPGATQTYTNYTNLTPNQLAPGVIYPISVTQVNTTATYYQSYLKVYIDYNQNGLFTDPGENVFAQLGPATATYNGFTGNFTVPTTATPGYTRMRFVLWQGGTATSVSPCSPSPATAYSYGETEDYTVFIMASPTATSNSPICQGDTVALFAGISSACATYSWTGPNGFTSTAQNPTILNASALQAGTYTVSVTAFGSTASSSTTVVVNPPVSTTATASICAGGSYTFGTQVLTTAGTYSQLFQTVQGCDSNVSLTLTVTPLPAPPTVTTPVSYCQGATATALTATGTNLLWYTTSTGGVGSATAPIPSTATVGTTKYYVSQTAAGCESARDSISVIVNAAQIISGTTSANPSTCNGTDGSITISGLSPGISYTVNYSKNGSPQTAIVATASTAGTITIANLGTGTYSSITVMLNGCASLPAGPITLNNPSAPAAPTAGSNSPICAGQNLNLTATAVAGVTYTWTGPNGFTSTSQNPVLAAATTAATGVYSVTATVNGCTSAGGNVTVTVNAIPAAPTAGSNSPICAGSALNLTAGTVTGATYNWTGPNGFTSTTQNPTIAAATIAASGTYSLTVTVAGCTSAAGTTTVVVNPIPAAPTAGSNSPICAGQSLNLTATTITGATYSWIGPNGFTSAAQNPTLASATTAASGTYSVTATVNGCTSIAGTVSVTVNPIPAAPTAASNSPICAGAALNLTASTVAGATYSWTGPNGFTSTAQNPSIASATTAASGIYSVTATVLGCTSAAGSTTVTVNALPLITNTTFANPTTCLGSNGSITLSGATNNASYSVTYTKNGTPQPSVSMLSSATGTITITGLTAGTYSNIIISINGCNSLPAGPVTLTDPAAPAAPTASNNGSVCVGSALNLTASTIAGASYSWTGPGGFSSSVQNPTIAGATAASAGVYSVTATVNNCTSVAGTTSVVVNPVPTIGSVTSVNPTTCNGTNGSITISGLGNNTTYTVNYILNGVAQTPLSMVSSATGTITLAGLAAGIYSGITVTLNGCTSTAAGPITLVNPAAPAAPTLTNNGPLCAGQTLNLTASTVAGATYSWTGPNAFTSTAQNPVIANAQAATAGVYSATVTVNGCTSAAATTTVVINPVPATPTITSVNPTTCGGTNGSITLAGLQANTNYTLNYVNNTTPVGPLAIVSLGTGTYTINNLSAGTYTGITITVNGCTSAAAGPVNLVSPSAPAPPAISSNTPLCQGGTINLTSAAVAGATYLWTGPNSFTSTAQNPSIPNAQPANGGVYTLTVTLNNCTSSPASTTVVVNPTPVIGTTSSTNPTTCGGTNGLITLNGLLASTSYTVNYSANGNPQGPTAITTNASGTLIIPSLGAGTYTNIQVTLNGCPSNIVGPFTLSNPASPAAPTASNNGPICAGASLTLNASTVAGATYAWTGPNGFTSNTQNPTIASATLANAGTYAVIVTVNNCSSNAGTTTVAINPAPVITAGSNSPICEGNNLNLTATSFAGATYSWTGPNAYSSTTQNPTVAAVTATAAGTYTVTASALGCTGTSSTTVVVNPIPPAPGTTALTYCQFSSASPLTATGQNLLWYTTATGGTGSTAAPSPSTATAGTFNWYVSQIVNGCESPRALLTVTVIPKPQPPIVVANATYCEGDAAATLTASGQNIKWYTTLTGGIGTTAAPTPSTTTPGTFTWYASQTIAGCESDRASITVVVNATPPLPSVVTPINYCLGDVASPLTAGGQNLLWYSTATGGTGSSTAPTPNTSTIGSTNYYVGQTVNNCESGRALITVVVSQQVGAKIALGSMTFCQYDTITVTNDTTNSPSAMYSWNFDGGIIVSGSGAGPYLVTWDTDGQKTVTLTVTNGNCSSSDSKQITVKPAPPAEFSLKEDACIDEVLTVQAAWNSLSNSSYTWNFGDATVINGSGPGAYKLKWTTPGEKAISLQTFGGGCKSKLFTDTLTIHESPAAKIEAVSKTNVCSGEPITLRAQTPSANTDYTYVWSPQEFFAINGQNETIAKVGTSGFIYLLVSDPYGCEAKDSVMINADACCEVNLPDAFSPNNDGKNDVFRIITIGYHQLASFRVVNRWGQTVFETGDERSGWDGNFGGAPQPVGTYFYYVRYKCGSEDMIEKKGEVTLIR